MYRLLKLCIYTLFFKVYISETSCLYKTMKFFQGVNYQNYNFIYRLLIIVDLHLFLKCKFSGISHVCISTHIITLFILLMLFKKIQLKITKKNDFLSSII